MVEIVVGRLSMEEAIEIRGMRADVGDGMRRIGAFEIEEGKGKKNAMLNGGCDPEGERRN